MDARHLASLTLFIIAVGQLAGAVLTVRTVRWTQGQSLVRPLILVASSLALGLTAIFYYFSL